MMKLILFLLLSLSGIASLISTQDLKQKNPETIFLTDDSLDEYRVFLKKAPYQSILSIQVDTDLSHLSGIVKEIKEVDPSLKVLSILDIPPMFREQALPIKLQGKDYLGLIVAAESKSFEDFLPGIKEALKSYDYDFSGIPYTNYMLDMYSANIQKYLLPLVFVFSAILLIVIVRSFLVALLLFLPCLFSAGYTLFFIKSLFTHMNMITAIIPLVCFTINLSLVLHLYFSTKEFSSLKKALLEKLTPIILMLLTTSVGFGSLIVSDVKVIRQFAILASFTIILSSVVSLLWIYCVEKILLNSRENTKFVYLKNKYFSKSLKLKWIFSLGIVSLVIAFVYFPKLQILTDATRYFPPSSGIRASMVKVSKNIIGMPIFDLVVPKDQLNSERIQALSDLKLTQDYKMIRSTSLNKIPFLSDLGKLLKVEEGHERLILSGIPNDASDYKKDLDKIKEVLGSTVESNGLYHNLMTSQSSMIATLVKSLLLSLLVVSIIAFLYTKSIFVFLIFLFVNITPVLLSSLFIYYLGGSINIATVMTYAISLGIIVDSSFHILHAFRAKEINFAIYISTVIKPILLSSVVFILSFFIFVLNDFLPIREFGINIVIMLILGLFFDLYILPTLINKNNDIEAYFK